ncbi:MAG: LysM peptidoglycan-binding domain-containing protein, partial [Deltaproteobacteria bacterium]|nr:LysM peptidoglycan-binding domain-containing protein [Deltaproteobacteria bacterium]
MRLTGSSNFWALRRYGTLKQETRDYVPKFLASLKIARAPERYGFRNLNYFSPLKFDTVTVPSRTDLAVIAHLCDVSYEEIKALNPELRRGCTPPGVRNYRVHIPRGKARTFTARYAQLPIEERVIHMAPKPKARVIAAAPHPQPAQKMVTSTYTVRKGDTLSQIAQRFNVGKNELQHWNSLNTQRSLRTGQRLNIAQMVTVMPHNSQAKSVATPTQVKSAPTAGKAVASAKKSPPAPSKTVAKAAVTKTDNRKNVPVTLAVTNKKTPAGKEKISAAKEKENVKAQVSKKAVTALPVTRKDTAASNSKNVVATKKKIVAANGSKTGRPGKRS